MRVLTAEDIPGENQTSPVHANDEPLLAQDLVQHVGQPIFAVVATDRAIARRAVSLARIVYDELPAILDIDSAKENGSAVVWRPLTMARGDVASALGRAPRRLRGTLTIGGQEHFYLEAGSPCPAW